MEPVSKNCYNKVLRKVPDAPWALKQIGYYYSNLKSILGWDFTNVLWIESRSSICKYKYFKKIKQKKRMKEEIQIYFKYTKLTHTNEMHAFSKATIYSCEFLFSISVLKLKEKRVSFPPSPPK